MCSVTYTHSTWPIRLLGYLLEEAKCREENLTHFVFYTLIKNWFKIGLKIGFLIPALPFNFDGCTWFLLCLYYQFPSCY